MKFTIFLLATISALPLPITDLASLRVFKFGDGLIDYRKFAQKLSLPFNPTPNELYRMLRLEDVIVNSSGQEKVSLLTSFIKHFKKRQGTSPVLQKLREKIISFFRSRKKDRNFGEILEVRSSYIARSLISVSDFIIWNIPDVVP
jgi:hypothetical protein